ncbi:MAG: TlpA disulfide reductase family protein [Planctomycetota bacterium]|nr:TlpA disulfide reductase family protein [Planctomycetota bacterium]
MMKYVANLIVLASMTTLASAQAPKPGPAHELLQQVAATYRDAGALTDSIDIDIKMPQGTQSRTMDISLSGEDEGHVSWNGYSFTGIDNSFFQVKDTLPTKYIRKSMEEGFIPALMRETRGGFPVPHLALRQANTFEQFVSAFGLGNFPNVKLKDVTSVTHNGEEMQALNFTIPQGTITAYVDPESKLIESIEAINGPVVVTINMQPRVYDALPEPIRFDTDKAREVETLRLEVGDPAPDFELEQPDGTIVRLSDFKGSMVVLDFWATWCGPCIRGLPELNKFARWAETSGHQVGVFAIDSFERVPTNAQKKQKIEQFWNARDFSFPTLIDYSGDTARAYEVGPIPHGVVIDTHGIIHKIHIGFNPRLFGTLKAEAAQIFEQ